MCFWSDDIASVTEEEMGCVGVAVFLARVVFLRCVFHGAAVVMCFGVAVCWRFCAGAA